MRIILFNSKIMQYLKIFLNKYNIFIFMIFDLEANNSDEILNEHNDIDYMIYKNNISLEINEENNNIYLTSTKIDKLSEDTNNNKKKKKQKKNKK